MQGQDAKALAAVGRAMTHIINLEYEQPMRPPAQLR
jgi:hypothetical protein